MTRFLPIVALLLAVGTHCHAGLIFFDDFESEPAPPHPPGYIPNYNSFQFWDVIGSGVDLVSPGVEFPPRVDSQMVDLDGTSGSTLVTKQAFDLQPGTYILEFRLGGPVGGETLDTVEVALGSVFFDSITVMENDPFVSFNYTIVVNSVTTGKLSFTDLGADSNGAYLDDVSLSQVPEPSACSMLLIGLSCIAGWRGPRVGEHRRALFGHLLNAIRAQAKTGDG